LLLLFTSTTLVPPFILVLVHDKLANGIALPRCRLREIFGFVLCKPDAPCLSVTTIANLSHFFISKCTHTNTFDAIAKLAQYAAAAGTHECVKVKADVARPAFTTLKAEPVFFRFALHGPQDIRILIVGHFSAAF